MIKALFSLLVVTLFLVGCGNSYTSTIVAYGCDNGVEWNTCKGKPRYLGDVSFIISKEGKSVKATQKPAKGVEYFTEASFNLQNCTITDSNNWSCKEKSPYGELYFISEMVDGFFMSSSSSEFIKGSGLNFVGYQGIKGQLIKYGIWSPTDIFKEGKKD